MRQILAICILSVPALLAQSTVTGSRTVQGSWDASGAAATKPAKAGAALPSTCGAGEFFFNTAATSGRNIYLCNPANTWTQVSAGGVTSVLGRTGVVVAQSGDYTFSQIGGAVASGQLPAAGGDISGGLAAATVKAIQGEAVGTTAPSSGQVLTWSGTQWVPQTVVSAVGGDISGTIAAATVKAIQGEAVGTTAPSSGQVLTWSGTQWVPQTVVSAVGGDISGTIAAATVKAIQGKAVGTTAPTTGQVLTWNGTQWVPQTVVSAVGGDISGTIAAATVKAIQGEAVGTTAPTTGQVLTWSGSQWAPQTAAGALGGDLSGTTTAATVQAIQGRSVLSLAPASGQVLTWNGTQWAPESSTGGGAVAVTPPYLQTGGVYYGPVFALTPPNQTTGWTWLNQGASSITTTNSAMYLQTAASSGFNVSGQMIATPATPYTITATFLPNIYNFVYPGSTGGATGEYPGCGLFWYQAGAAGGTQFALRTFGYVAASSTSSPFTYLISKYHSATSQFGNGGLLPFSSLGAIQMQLHDDGANQTMQLSNDGVNWTAIDTLPSTQFIIADHVGFYCDSYKSNTAPGMTLLSWQVH